MTRFDRPCISCCTSTKPRLVIEHIISPPEVLEEIFLNHPGYLQETAQPLEGEHCCVAGEDCPLFCWSHVCRQWRAGALRSRLLSAALPVSHMDG